MSIYQLEMSLLATEYVYSKPERQETDQLLYISNSGRLEGNPPSKEGTFTQETDHITLNHNMLHQ